MGRDSQPRNSLEGRVPLGRAGSLTLAGARWRWSTDPHRQLNKHRSGGWEAVELENGGRSQEPRETGRGLWG